MNSSTQDQIQNFIDDKTDLPKIVVVYGPTACGKTALSIEIAQLLNSEIISTDSRQNYRYMDIGTGKITPEEMQWIPHHMIDIINPDQRFSVVDYRERAQPILEELWSKQKIPVLCGGTWLYIDSLIYERSYPEIATDWTLRNELETYRLAYGNEALWQKLHAIDPEYASTLHHNNYRYVIRGIEVYTKCGQSKGSIRDTPQLKYKTLFLTPYDDNRSVLYNRIDLRVQEMFDNWLIQEVEYISSTLPSKLWQNCNNLILPGLATIGYAEVVDHLAWKSTLAECISLVQQHNRNYAKRQITWNKKYEQSIRLLWT